MTMKYRIDLRDDGGSTIGRTIKAESMDAAMASAHRWAERWVEGGEWPAEGCSVRVRIDITGDDGESDYDVAIVDVEPREGDLARQAGADPDCRHRWVPVAEGCRENPGVWSLGGTAMLFRSRCRRCGLIRETLDHGAQRQPDRPAVEVRFFRD